MPLPILVTGGTGTLGQQVVARLRAAGRDVRILSRRTGDGLVTGDLATGQGLAAAVQHVGTIVHCASNRKGDAQATLGRRTWPDFLTSTTREVFRGV
ncbi:MAG TPA: NAD-dependent epimerase/dehydratase family protein [Streptosporangiaceae bacterium]|nr:NAD-dependent epimerase/dehydratase family protein [Streptosporangiaceae bacterium]